MKDPRVTVTIPVLNGIEYLSGCMKILDDQIFRDFEVVFVIDNRSDGDVIEVIRGYCDDNCNARFVIQKHGGGLAEARNIGIDEARGDLIWFMDIDDYAYPTFLKEMVNIIDNNDADIVFCNHYEFCTKKIPIIPDCMYKIERINQKYALDHFTELPINSWSRIQRKTIFESGIARFINRPAAEDIEQTIRSIYVSNNIYYYEKPLYVYYKTKKTATVKNRRKEIESLESTVKSLVELMGDKTTNDFRKRIVERMMRQSAFSSYSDYSKSYRGSYSHKLLSEISEKTLEMKIYELSKLLYYLILFPFTHLVWDRKEGMWDKVV